MFVCFQRLRTALCMPAYFSSQGIVDRSMLKMKELFTILVAEYRFQDVMLKFYY